MKDLKKIATRQDSYFKLSPSLSNETSINLSNEISTFISDKSREVTFTIYREDFVKAISALCLMPRIYKKKEQMPSTPFEILSELYNLIEVEFGDSNTSEYTIYHFKRDDGRFYLNNLKLKNGFNLRSFLVEQLSLIHFIKNDDGQLTIRLETRLPGNDIERIEVIPSFDEIKDSEPLQQIFYGAPGTGKSDTISKRTNPENSIRTTFHPDSDYSTFVGAYKPSMDENTKPSDASLATDSHIYTSEDKPSLSYGGSVAHDSTKGNSRIVYKFIPQAFLKAYVAAWKAYADGTPYYLIIEEINRGNCAQIFGDLFQLLDRRDDGFSTYPISPDNDIRKFLANDKEGFQNLQNEDGEAYSAISQINLTDSNGKSIVKGSEILSGEKLILPPNMFIWATMNTSDQSLFPIDSAFKRRWDWKYIRIKEGKDKNGNPLKWQINLRYDKAKESDSTEEKENTDLPQTTTADVISTTEDLQTQFDWWQFVKAINRIIASMTSSGDKQLGYFFCKANKDGVIDGQTFVGKVLFYLWNDVFKDYGFDDPSLFQYKSTIEGKTVDNDLAFEDFYDENDDEKINVVRVSDFISKVQSWEKDTKKSDY